MKKAKRMLSVLLAVFLLAGCLPLAVSAGAVTSGKCGENAEWSYDSATNTLTISGTGAIADYEAAMGNTAPWADWAADITSVVIEKGITEIGNNALSWLGELTSISIPEGVTRIGEGAFRETGSPEIDLPDSLSVIEESAFYGSGFSYVKIPDNVAHIGDYAFNRCGLLSVTLPANLISIGAHAFSQNGLTSVVIPDKTTTIGSFAFGLNPNNLVLTIPKSVTYIGEAVMGGGTIKGKRGSYAEEYAKNWAGVITFVAIDDSSTPTPTPSTPTTPSTPSDTEDPDDTEDEKPTTSVSDFKDVVATEYYYNAVDWAVKQGIVAGTSDTTFSPNQNTTRAQIVTFLWRAAGRPEPTVTSNPFKDVSPKEYYYKAVMWAYENKIVAGTSDTAFSPDQKCTRAQTVTFLYRYNDSPTASGSGKFTDVPNREYYASAVAWATANKIVFGTSEDKFSPENSCTRAQSVTFLYRNLAE